MAYIGLQYVYWSTTGKYVYPFLAVFSMKMTVIFYSVLFGVCFVMDRLNSLIINLRWKREIMRTDPQFISIVRKISDWEGHILWRIIED